MGIARSARPELDGQVEVTSRMVTAASARSEHQGVGNVGLGLERTTQHIQHSSNVPESAAPHGAPRDGPCRDVDRRILQPVA